MSENELKESAEIRQKIQRLEAKIKTLREENTTLLDKQSVTNQSISDYISEMSTMLSSAELESALALEHADSDSDEEYDQRPEENNDR